MDSRVRFSHYDASCPMIDILVEGHEYSFSVACVAEDSREWLGEVIAHHLQLAYTRGMRKGMTEVQTDIKKALGL